MFGRRKKVASATGGAMLRSFVLTGELPERPADAPGRATVAVMEIGVGGGIATVCSFIDGATSLYLSTGGGVIGVGTDKRANAASRAFIVAMEGALESLTPTAASDQLSNGEVKFLLRIGDDLFGADCKESEVLSTDHPLHPLWRLGQEVLTWIRIVSEERKGH